MQPGQLKAKKAIYGFAEAARLFWPALKEHLEMDGWAESKLEPAVFYYRVMGHLKGILVIEFATNHVKDFIFRGREIKQLEAKHVDVTMRNYSVDEGGAYIEGEENAAGSAFDIQGERVYLSSSGDPGWVTRQLRFDLAFENGVAQRSKVDPRVADLIRLKQYVGSDRSFGRLWTFERDTRKRREGSLPKRGRIFHHDSQRWSPGWEDGQGEHPELPLRSDKTSFPAAEASHLSEAVEAGDWMLLEEALSGKLDLRSIQQRPRVYVTDARSAYDYLQRDAILQQKATSPWL